MKEKAKNSDERKSFFRETHERENNKNKNLASNTFVKMVMDKQEICLFNTIQSLHPRVKR